MPVSVGTVRTITFHPPTHGTGTVAYLFMFLTSVAVNQNEAKCQAIIKITVTLFLSLFIAEFLIDVSLVDYAFYSITH